MKPALLPAVALALVGALLPARPAATQQAPVFGASADLVVIDLIATQGDGRLVADLRTEEIEVYEDGKRQRVEFARFVTAGDLEAAAAPASPTCAPARTWRSRTRRRRRRRGGTRSRRWSATAAAASPPRLPTSTSPDRVDLRGSRGDPRAGLRAILIS